MKLEDFFNAHLISEIKTGKKFKVHTSKNYIYISAGMYYRVGPFPKQSLITIYVELRDKCPKLAAKIMSDVLGSKK